MDAMLETDSDNSIGWFAGGEDTQLAPCSFLREAGAASNTAHLHTVMAESHLVSAARHVEFFSRGANEALHAALLRVYETSRGAGPQPNLLLRLYVDPGGDAFALVELWLRAPPSHANYLLAWPEDRGCTPGRGCLQVRAAHSHARARLSAGACRPLARTRARLARCSEHASLPQVMARGAHCVSYADLREAAHLQREAVAALCGALDTPTESYERVLDSWLDARRLLCCAPVPRATGQEQDARAATLDLLHQHVRSFELCLRAHNDAREACGLARHGGL